MSVVLQCFREKLSHKPYYTDSFAYGARILLKNTAILARLIRQNQPHVLYWPPLDMDRMRASVDWSDRNCPAPGITVKNPRDGHAYLPYAFALPVRVVPDASALALKYAAAIGHVLCEKLGADVNYSDLICKNPCYPEWQEVKWREEPCTLDGLADYPDLSASARRSVDKNYGLGRDYHLFERIRKRTYKAIR